MTQNIQAVMQQALVAQVAAGEVNNDKEQAR